MIAPDLPPQTCPKIDKAREIVEAAQAELRRIARDTNDGDAECEIGDVIDDLVPVLALLEDLRDANGKLRDAAEEWAGKADDLEDERDELRREVSDKDDKIAELEDERDELRREVSDKDDKIAELERANENLLEQLGNEVDANLAARGAATSNHPTASA